MDKKNNMPENQASLTQTKLATQLIVNLTGMLKAIHLYPKGHQMLLQVIEKFFSHLKEVLAAQSPVVLKIFNSRLYSLNVVLVPEKVPGLEDFIEQLQSRYIRQIIFDQNVSIADISSLVNVLNSPPESIVPQGGAGALLAQNGTQGIQIIEYYSKKHHPLSQLQLQGLAKSELLSEFCKTITKDINDIDEKQALFLYDLLKDPSLVAALIKLATGKKEQSNPAEMPLEIKNTLEILNKIQHAVTALGLSEEKETQAMLSDILKSLNKEDLFSLSFENQENPLIKKGDPFSFLADNLEADKLSQLIISKITASNFNPSAIEHTKHILKRLFVDRKAFLNFLPKLKHSLEEQIPDKNKRDAILNDICSSLAPKFSLDENSELQLGLISESEKNDLVEGLNVLKTVSLDKKTLRESIKTFDLSGDYIAILQTLLQKETDAVFFQKTTEKLINILQGLLKNKDFARSGKVIDFIINLLSAASPLSPEIKQAITVCIKNCPSSVLTEFTLAVLNTQETATTETFLNKLCTLFNKTFISILLQIYTSEKNPPHETILQQLIIKHYSAGVCIINKGLRQASPATIMRLIDLLQKIDSDDILLPLQEIIFHENVIIAERALKLAAQRKSALALDLLLKTLAHPRIAIRIAGIEYLGAFKDQQIITALAPIALGTISGENTANVSIRIAALESLSKIDLVFTKNTAQHILRKKNFIVFPLEPKQLRETAKRFI